MPFLRTKVNKNQHFLSAKKKNQHFQLHIFSLEGNNKEAEAQDIDLKLKRLYSQKKISRPKEIKINNLYETREQPCIASKDRPKYWIGQSRRSPQETPFIASFVASTALYPSEKPPQTYLRHNSTIEILQARLRLCACIGSLYQGALELASLKCWPVV